jgi:hypothetical protein
MEEIMNLIDRYVYEVGRHLPRKNRSDIQIELRSSLVDALEDRAGENPNEADIIALLQEFGPPKTVAASYFPEGQYLIGPSLYPLFRMVAGIALAAVIGAQVLAWGVAVFIAEVPFAPLEAFGGILNSIPIALGMVVIVFAILQRFDVRPDFEDERWDPASLPQISDFEPVSRGERIFGIIVSIIILGVVTSFPGIIGFVTFPGGEFYANPVIPQYLGWISISLLLGIGLDIYLLWQGRWTSISRIAKIAVNILSIIVLSLLVQGHTAWLAERGAGGFLSTLTRLSTDIVKNTQVIGMQAWRMAFGIALIVTVIDTLAVLYRLVRANLGGGLTLKSLPARKA